jgi:hypothetical protein|tara:strand:+ start:6405 stop:6539 length:135 start_codon:yes stop_codon:yes gene_type:complete
MRSGADGVKSRLGEEQLVPDRQLAPLELPDPVDIGGKRLSSRRI